MRAEPAVAISENGACQQAPSPQAANLVGLFDRHSYTQSS